MSSQFVASLRSNFRAVQAVARFSPVRHTRSFHSPFAVLSDAPRNASSANQSASYAQHETQFDNTPEPEYGSKVYVVSEPDPTNAPYQVPSGAYPVSEPFVGQDYNKQK